MVQGLWWWCCSMLVLKGLNIYTHTHAHTFFWRHTTPPPPPPPNVCLRAFHYNGRVKCWKCENFESDPFIIIIKNLHMNTHVHKLVSECVSSENAILLRLLLLFANWCRSHTEHRGIRYTASYFGGAVKTAVERLEMMMCWWESGGNQYGMGKKSFVRAPKDVSCMLMRFASLPPPPPPCDGRRKLLCCVVKTQSTAYHHYGCMFVHS